MAILELPRGGGQVLVRKGSVIDGGTVTELSARKLRIAWPDHVVELLLNGSMRDGAGPTVKTVARPAAQPGPPPGAARVPRVPRNVVALPPVIRSPSAGLVRVFLANGVPQAPPNTDAKRYVDGQIAETFDLPPQSQVQKINDIAVASASQTVDALQKALQNGTAVIDVATPQGPQRVYMSPERTAGR